jgi:hypothetical protein
MARMHPESIDDYEGATDGEKRVFRFIREAARPHKDYVCWYEPSIGSSGKEPDFVLFGKNLGLLVLEVKDWANHQILSYDPHQFTVMTAGKAEDRTNPEKQAKGYVNALRERLKQSPDLLSNRPGYWGSPKIPIGRMVVFPNLSRHEYFDRALQHLIPEERVLIAEDLDPGGEILLCDKIIGEPVHFENEDSDYYDLVTQTALEKAVSGSSIEPFDAILVDEGQDFSDDMLKVLLALLRPGGDLAIGLDSYQDLYRRRRSWKSLGIQAAGRTRYLKKVYRNTIEIFEFTQRFIGEVPRVEKQLTLLPVDFAFHGDPPTLRRFENSDEMEDFVLQDLAQCLKRGEYKRSEVAVIYDDKVYSREGFAYDNRGLPERLLGKLEGSGIPTNWVSQDVRSKEMFDITTDRVSLISIHSSKGLDFDLVYLVGMDHFRPMEETIDAVVSVVYVAMTRAKYRLVIPYVEETEFIARMKRCLSA